MRNLEISASVPEEDDRCQKQEAKERPSYHMPMSSMFAYADKVDYLLMFLGAAGSCVHGAALPLFMVLFGRMIDSLGSLLRDPHKLASEISKHALQLVYLGLAIMVSAWLGVACWMQTGERQTARLRVKYIQSVLKQDMRFFNKNAKEENIIHHISSDTVLVQDAIGDKTGHCLRYVSQFVVGFIIGFSSVWQLTLLTLAVLPLMVIAGGTYTIMMAGLSKKGEAAYAEAGNVAEETISQVRTVYSYVGESKAIEAYYKSLKNALKLGKKSGLAKGLGVGFTYGLLFCTWALLLWYASILVRHHVTNGGKAFTTILNVIISGFSLGQAAPNLGSIAKGRAAAGNILRMIESVPKSSVLEDGMVLQKVEGHIEFCGVSFAYPSRKDKIFENLSFSITAGRTFAVVGQSGSGKSTIISMIERFYDPISGRILLDGHDIAKLQMKWLRKQIGLVSQEPALFSTSIAENILHGREDAEIRDIMEAAKVANADRFIQMLPDSYLTQVGEGGTQLSGGQKQRIAIARAVLRNPKILLLDEATSALDAESEHTVQQALDRVMLNRTTVVVAHRLSTICNADTIIVLKDGQVIESGSHLELMAKGEYGEYAKIVRLQVSANSQDWSKDDYRNSTGPSRTLNNSEISYSQRNHQKAELGIQNDLHSNKDNSDHANSASTSSLWKVIRLNKPEWPFALLGSLGAILAGIEAPLFALGITHVLTAFYSQEHKQMKHEVQRISLIFIGAAVFTVPIYLLQHYFYTMMGERLTTRVRFLMLSAMLRNEIGWFDLDENSSGALASRLASDATTVRSALADRLSTLVQNVSLTVTAFVIAFFLSWRMAAVVIATYPLLIGASIAEQLFLKGFGGNYACAYARANSLAREAITNIRTVAAFGAEDRVSAQFASLLNQPSRQACAHGHISGICYGLSQLLAFCSYALALWYASRLLLEHHSASDFGSVMKSFMILIITALSVAETLALAPDIARGSRALGSVFSILDRKTAIDPDDPSSEQVGEIRGEIEFRNVAFRYPTRPEVPVLDGFSLRVPAGTSLAIVGLSGSGKSSVISLLMRFYDPIAGTVLIDGRDIKTLNLRSLRRKIALVQQEPVLFSTTIHDNIAYGKGGGGEATEEEVVRAARAANAHGFISGMAEGYRTRVGERGGQLSGGQKQRVAIARALLRDPAVLLMDEATSALDAESEREVQGAVEEMVKGRRVTVVVVAHRLTTVREAKKIAVMGGGRVVEEGSHRELMERRGGVYKQLVCLQQQRQQQAEELW